MFLGKKLSVPKYLKKPCQFKLMPAAGGLRFFTFCFCLFLLKWPGILDVRIIDHISKYCQKGLAGMTSSSRFWLDRKCRILWENVKKYRKKRSESVLERTLIDCNTPRLRKAINLQFLPWTFFNKNMKKTTKIYSNEYRNFFKRTPGVLIWNSNFFMGTIWREGGALLRGVGWVVVC